MRRLWFAVVLACMPACNCGSDVSPDAATPADAGALDAGLHDAGTPDAGTFDGGTVDAGVLDSGVLDSGVLDAGSADAGFIDAGSVDAGAPDAGFIDAGSVDAGGPDAGCGYGTAASLATPGTLDLFGQISYFGDGGALPAGRYRVQYVDGCMKYSSSQGWTIHAYVDGAYGWWLVRESGASKVIMPPGTVGWSPAAGAFAVFADCVTANLALPPLDFDFDGGQLGIWLQDSPYSDNLAGENGRNPAWQLTRLGTCTP